jgi:hypothetical protein
MATKKKKEKPLSQLMKEIGTEANDSGRMLVLKECEKAGITIPKVLKGIAEGMEAKEVKVTYSAQESEWQYSEEQIAWQIRQAALNQAIAVLGIKAPEKIDSKIKADGPITFQVEFDSKPTDDGK